LQELQLTTQDHTDASFYKLYAHTHIHMCIATIAQCMWMVFFKYCQSAALHAAYIYIPKG